LKPNAPVDSDDADEKKLREANIQAPNLGQEEDVRPAVDKADNVNPLPN
jgi:hypothetical protein